MSLKAAKFPSSLFRRNLQKCRSDCKKKAFIGEPVPWRFQRFPSCCCGVRPSIFGHVECVGFVDLILDADVDVVVLLVATNSLFLRRLFVGGEWEVSLAWNDG